MKYVMSLLFLSSLPAFAQTITLDEFNYPVIDVKSRGLSKEELFKSMNRTLVRHQDSICSNRAQMWAFDFKRKFDLDSPKIFLFFTPKNSRTGGWLTGISWWYHVSPMINEGGQFFVMDAGFPGHIKSPLLLKDWLTKFTGKDHVCKEIRDGEDDLVSLIFKEQTFPQETKYGKYDCYYKVVPAGYWVPGQVAKNILGRDEAGRPVRLDRTLIEEKEVFEACLEASTTPAGWAWGNGYSKCNWYMSHGVR